MTYTNSEIEAKITGLNPNSRTLFAASCCERMIPNYQAFVYFENWGNYKAIQEVLESIWDYLSGKKYTDRKIELMMEKCEKNMPDSDLFTSIYSELASDAVESVMYAIEAIIDTDATSAINVSRNSLKSIQNYLDLMADPRLDVHGSDARLEKWIQESPLLQFEIDQQISDLEQIRSATTIDAKLIEVIRNSSLKTGIQPRMRGLIK